MKHDIFISYRRDGGFETARYLYDHLTWDGYHVTFDLDSLRGGRFDDALLERIDECMDFVIVLNKGCFDRTLNPDFPRENDWMRRELGYAIKKKKNVIPVLLGGFDFPAALPEDIDEVRFMNAPPYSREYIDSFYEKLKAFLRTARPASGGKADERKTARETEAVPRDSLFGKLRRGMQTVASAIGRKAEEWKTARNARAAELPGAGKADERAESSWTADRDPSDPNPSAHANMASAPAEPPPVDFMTAWKRGWTRWSWKGRTTRAEFWWRMVSMMIETCVALVVFALLVGENEAALGGLILLLMAVYAVQSTGLSIRRLHDSGKAGWWIWISCIPWVGTVVLLWLLCQKGDKGKNAYG